MFTDLGGNPLVFQIWKTVTCPQCQGTHYVPDPNAQAQGNGWIVTRQCPTCDGDGFVLRQMPSNSTIEVQ